MNRDRPSNPRTQRDALHLPQGNDIGPADTEEAGPASPGVVTLTDAQRETFVRQSLTRFVRNKAAPSELEDLRYNLIVARVLSGMTAMEAAEKFGYANSTQLSLIESGQRKTPNDWKFIRQAAQTYSVSTDFLLSLSPHTEFDATVSRQYALLRRTEDLIGGIAAQLSTALIRFSEDDAMNAGECDRLSAAAHRVDEVLNILRTRHGFDDLRGGAPLAAAVDALNSAAEPVRRRIRKRRVLEDYINDVRAGRLPVIEHLSMRYRADQAGEKVIV